MNMEMIRAAADLAIFHIRLLIASAEVNKSSAIFAAIVTLIFCRCLHSSPF
jgi:hypothetical protein